MKDFLTKDYKEKDIVWVAGHPLPPAFPFRPVHGLKSALALRHNKEDTTLVYEVANSINRSTHIRKFGEFLATEYGRRVVETPIKIEDLLGDYDYLKSLPKGSVGQIYHEFMSRQSYYETALLDATKATGIDFTTPNRFKAFCRQMIHYKVTHDLWHILTGYKTDVLGETLLLKFYNAQFYDRALAFIVNVGSISMRRQMKNLPMKALLKEAHNNAKAANWIMGFDVKDYLPKPLVEVRDMMNIRPPELYHSISDDVKSVLLQPKSELEAAE